jgi:chromate transporter
VVALIAAPLLGLSRSAGVNRKNLWIPLVVALTVWLLKISPIFIILAAILLGLSHLAYLKILMKK